MLPERVNAGRLQRRLPVRAAHTLTTKLAGLGSLVVVGPVSVVLVSTVGVVAVPPVLAVVSVLSFLSSPPLVAMRTAAPAPPTRTNAAIPAMTAIRPLRRRPPPPPLGPGAPPGGGGGPP